MGTNTSLRFAGFLLAVLFAAAGYILNPSVTYAAGFNVGCANPGFSMAMLSSEKESGASYGEAWVRFEFRGSYNGNVHGRIFVNGSQVADFQDTVSVAVDYHLAGLDSDTSYPLLVEIRQDDGQVDCTGNFGVHPVWMRKLNVSSKRLAVAV